jgi:hypothetical protein
MSPDAPVPVPVIIGPARYSRLQTDPPVLRVELGAVRFFAVELASDPRLFDAASADLRTSDNFFASWQDRLIGPVEDTTYAIPSAAWRKLRTQRALYYRVLTSAAGSGWEAPAASTLASQAASAPTILVTDDTPPLGPRSTDPRHW